MTTALRSTVLFDVVDPAMLADMLTAGYVRKQVHPSEPYTILNYTEKAAYESVWNNVTRRSRGLIYNHDTNEVLARPFAKFMNWGQTGAPDLELHERVCVTDKADGSLGILYPTPDGWAVATRGSFASEQAIHATALLRDPHAYFTPPAGFTVLTEIVYPENRIVLDYGGLDDLILLGAVNIATGKSIGPTDDLLVGWKGLRTAVFQYATLADALAAEPRPNAEGLVVQVLRTDERVKLKQADYVALHKIVTGLSARTVWQHLVDGKPLDELIAPLPDEFHGWTAGVADGLTSHVASEQHRLNAEFRGLIDLMPSGWVHSERASRAEFARVASQHPDKWAMFALLDSKDIRVKLLHDAKPEAYVTPSGRIFTEDNA